VKGICDKPRDSSAMLKDLRIVLRGRWRLARKVHILTAICERIVQTLGNLLTDGDEVANPNSAGLQPTQWPSLDLSNPYGPLEPVTAMDLPFTY
jgi:hypothetical protein